MMRSKTKTYGNNGSRPGNKGRDRSLAAGITAHQKGEFESAKQLYGKILAQNPRHADALHLLGLIAHQQSRHAEAVELMSRSLVIETRNAVCHCNLGAALMELGRVDDAIASYDRALVVDPAHANAFVNRGLSLVHLERFSEALASFENALRLDPGFLSALYNRAKLLVLLKRPEDADEAISAYVGAVSAAPNDVVVLNNLGALLQSAGRLDEAIVFLTYAIESAPESADLHFCRGNVFVSLNRPEEACADFNRVLELDPAHLGALNNRGNTFMSRRMFPEALSSYNEVVRHFPNRALGHFNQGNALHELGWWYEALGSYEIALELNPDFDGLPGKIAHLRGRFCQWQGDDAFVEKIISDLAAGRIASEAFPLFMLTDDQALLRNATERWVRDKVRGTGRLGPLLRRPKKNKVHIAYLSADFHNHATSQLAVEMFERHDRERFEVTAISFGPDQQDAMRKRLMRAFDRFEDVRHLSDLEVAARCRELEVDIAIDLKAYLQDSRPGILAERCAPIQVNWLAFPGTMASPYIDYIVADRTLITPEDLPFYSEKVIWLPDSYQVNDRQRPIATDVVTRTECGLPEEGLVFCCFNNSFKIRPDTFDVWMRILKRVPGSVLWLLGESPVTTENLKREAASRGVEPNRLVFASRIPGAAHLARHGAADLFLDTWPCNAHTTASDALWAGLPVLTRIGESFSSRVAASLLSAVGLPTLIMRTNEEYEDMAVALASRPEALASLKQRLRGNRDNCPLFDSARFTRQIEDAYQQVMQRYWSGVEANHIAVAVDDHDTRIANEGVGEDSQARPISRCAVIDDIDGSPQDVHPRTNTSCRSLRMQRKMGQSAMENPSRPDVHIVIMQPPGYVHSLAFVDPARFIRYQLRRLGVKVTMAKNRLRGDAVNLVLGAHLGFPESWLDRHACLFVNLEQLGLGGAKVSDDYLRLLKTSAVVDYDLANVSAYDANPTDVPLLPFRHAPYLDRMGAMASRLEDRPIDLLFFGSMNERRRRLIQRIAACGIKVKTFEQPLYGEERDRYICQAKAVLNCHFYESATFEQVRVFHCLSLGTPVISERSSATRPDAAFDSSVFWFEEGTLESFFERLFASPTFFDVARLQLQLWRSHDPVDAYADLMACAESYLAGHAERRPDGPWRPTQINLGSGKDYRAGWLNLDVIDRAEPDLVLDLGQPQSFPIEGVSRFAQPFVLAPASVEKVYANNVLEHVPDLPCLMTNVLALLVEGGSIEIEVPYEKARTAWQDPTHIRAMNEGSWIYYSQWFWYLGWYEYRFELADSTYLDESLQPCAQPQAAFMRVVLRKVATSPWERMQAQALQADVRLPDDEPATLADSMLPLGKPTRDSGRSWRWKPYD